jgi:hypothetical protein
MHDNNPNSSLVATDLSSKVELVNQEQTPIIGYLQHKSFAKLFLLNLFTFNVYRFYWFYENWDAIRNSERRDILPFWRSVFRWFYIHALFERIYQSAKQQGYKAEVRCGLFATLIIVLGIVSYVVEKSIEKHGASLTNVSLFLCLWLVSDLLFWPIQRLINFYNTKLTQTQINLTINFNSPTKYFEISPIRFVLLNILTLSFYFNYWQYKNWQAIKQADKSHIWPFWRAIFSFNFIHVLFKRIAISAKNQGYSKSISYLALAAIRFQVIWLFGFVLGFARAFEMNNEMTTLGRWLIFLFVVMICIILAILVDYFVVIPFQKAVSFYNAKADTTHQSRRGFRRGEIILIILGIILWSCIWLSILFKIVV